MFEKMKQLFLAAVFCCCVFAPLHGYAQSGEKKEQPSREKKEDKQDKDYCKPSPDRESCRPCNPKKEKECYPIDKN